MRSDWLSDPIFWVLALPALAVSGLLVQMVLSLFRCCAAFALRGRAVQLKWWMIPVTGGACGLLWAMGAAYVFWVS